MLQSFNNGTPHLCLNASWTFAKSVQQFRSAIKSETLEGKFKSRYILTHAFMLLMFA